MENNNKRCRFEENNNYGNYLGNIKVHHFDTSDSVHSSHFKNEVSNYTDGIVPINDVNRKHYYKRVMLDWKENYEQCYNDIFTPKLNDILKDLYLVIENQHVWSFTNDPHVSYNDIYDLVDPIIYKIRDIIFTFLDYIDCCFIEIIKNIITKFPVQNYFMCILQTKILNLVYKCDDIKNHINNMIESNRIIYYKIEGATKHARLNNYLNKIKEQIWIGVYQSIFSMYIYPNINNIVGFTKVIDNELLALFEWDDIYMEKYNLSYEIMDIIDVNKGFLFK